MTTPLTDMEQSRKVASEFVRMYYKVMRSFIEYLHLFYEEDSTVVVYDTHDDSPSLSLQADNPENLRKLLQWMYEDVTVTLFTCIPQASLNNSVLLLVTGKIKRKTYVEPRGFSQALLLKKQMKGYYVKTDTMHIMSQESSTAFIVTPVVSQTTMLHDLLKKTATSGPHGKRHQVMDSCTDCALMLRGYDEKNKTDAVVPSTYHEGAVVPAVDGKTDKQNDLDSRESDCKSMDQPNNKSSMSTPTVLHRSSCLSLYEKSTAPSANTDHLLRSDGEKQIKSASGTFRDTSRTNNDSPYMPNTNSMSFNCSENGEVFKQPELKSMFAARLPLGTTPAAVYALFSKYGTLQKDNAVKVFTGSTNCYACVTFASECEMRKALESEIRLEGIEIVKEIWAPRDRRGRRVGREITHRPDSTRGLYCAA